MIRWRMFGALFDWGHQRSWWRGCWSWRLRRGAGGAGGSCKRRRAAGRRDCISEQLGIAVFGCPGNKRALAR
ncbi:hypothetical protein ACKS0A_06216 [Histoplasma ohiense]